MTDLSKTIEAKSDQMNADDLIGAPRTITVTSVSKGNTEQPISIHYEGGEGKPFKPCKSMRRLLVKLWGKDGSTYAGKQMTLFCDDKVMFAGQKVGGIRISHMSHIEKDCEVSLTVRRGAKAPYKVKKLKTIDTVPILKAGEEAANKGMTAFKEWGQSLKPEEKQAIRGQLKYLTEVAKENGE